MPDHIIFPTVRGGQSGKYDIQEGEGVMENQTNLDKGREGVKNPRNFADIICTWPLEGDDGVPRVSEVAPSSVGERHGLQEVGSLRKKKQ